MSSLLEGWLHRTSTCRLSLRQKLPSPIMLKVYTDQGCSTCKAATKWLKAKSIAFDEKPIRETPPSIAELKAMLKARGDLKPLFNTSGQDYRAMGIKDKLADMSETEALKLL